MLLTTYKDLSNMPLCSPFSPGITSIPTVVLLVPFAGSLVVPFDGVLTGSVVVFAVASLVVVLVLLLTDAL